MVATPFFRNIDFIIPVAIDVMPGSAVTMSGIDSGIGIAGLATGETRSFRSKSFR
jgi:hypothetical protein